MAQLLGVAQRRSLQADPVGIFGRVTQIMQALQAVRFKAVQGVGQTTHKGAQTMALMAAAAVVDISAGAAVVVVLMTALLIQDAAAQGAEAARVGATVDLWVTAPVQEAVTVRPTMEMPTMLPAKPKAVTMQPTINPEKTV